MSTSKNRKGAPPNQVGFAGVDTSTSQFTNGPRPIIWAFGEDVEDEDENDERGARGTHS